MGSSCPRLHHVVLKCDVALAQIGAPFTGVNHRIVPAGCQKPALIRGNQWGSKGFTSQQLNMWRARGRRVLWGFSEEGWAVCRHGCDEHLQCFWKCLYVPLFLTEAGPPQVNWHDVLEQLPAFSWNIVLFVCVTRINTLRADASESSCRVTAPGAVYNWSVAEEEVEKRKGWGSLDLRICEPVEAGLTNRMPLARLIWAFLSVCRSDLSVSLLINHFQPAASKAARPIVQNSCRVASRQSGAGAVTSWDRTFFRVFWQRAAVEKWLREFWNALCGKKARATVQGRSHRSGALTHFGPPSFIISRFQSGAFNRDFLFLFVAERCRLVRMKHLAWRGGSEWTKNECMSCFVFFPPSHNQTTVRRLYLLS